MRTRVILPIIALLLLLLLVLGLAVAGNTSVTIHRLIDTQLEVSLNFVQSRLAEQSSEELSSADYQAAVAGVGIGSDGGVFVVGEKGLIVADSTGLLLNHSVAAEAWFTQAKDTMLVGFEASFGQTPIYAQARQSNDYLIISYLPAAELESYLTTPLYIIAVLGVLALAIVGLLIYLLLTRLLIDPLESFSEQAKTLRPGDSIRARPLRACKELVAAARNINALIAARPAAEPVDVQPAAAPAEAESVQTAATPAQVQPAAASPAVKLVQTAATPAKVAATAPAQPVAASPAVKPVRVAAKTAGERVDVQPATAPTEAKLVQTATTTQAKVATAPAQVFSEHPLSDALARARAAQNARGAGFEQVATVFIATDTQAAQEVVFKDLVRATVEPLRPLISAQQLKFSLLVDKRIPATLLAEPDTVLPPLQELFSAVLTAANRQDKVRASVTKVPLPAESPPLLGADSRPKQPLSLKFSVKRGYQVRTLIWTVYQP